MSIGDFPESLSQAMLVGIMLVGRLGALDSGFQRVSYLLCQLIMFSCVLLAVGYYVQGAGDHHNFLTHPHYHGPCMTYFPGRYMQKGLTKPSQYFTRGALQWGRGWHFWFSLLVMFRVLASLGDLAEEGLHLRAAQVGA